MIEHMLHQCTGCVWSANNLLSVRNKSNFFFSLSISCFCHCQLIGISNQELLLLAQASAVGRLLVSAMLKSMATSAAKALSVARHCLWPLARIQPDVLEVSLRWSLTLNGYLHISNIEIIKQVIWKLCVMFTLDPVDTENSNQQKQTSPRAPFLTY